MKKKKEKKEKDLKKFLGLRIVAFAIAVIIAVVSISHGVSELGKKEEGWQEIKAQSSSEEPLYASGFEFQYYCTGSSSQIKEEIKLITSIYSSALERAYKLFNVDNKYTGYNNLASLNGINGLEIELEPDLYNALFDAYEKTLEKKGFNLFSGALYKEWEKIIYSFSQSEFDPIYSIDEKERIETIANVVNDLDNFTLEQGSKEYSVIFRTSDTYNNFVNEYEIDASPIDFNVLKNAYIVEILKDTLVANGKTNGYIQTDDGLLLKLIDGELIYNMYGFKRNNEAMDTEKISLVGNTIVSAFNFFPLGPDDYSAYVLYNNGQYVFRNMYFDVFKYELIRFH